MRQVFTAAAAGLLAAGLAGCCDGPCRFYENAYGFNNPDIEHYAPGPPPPVTTPPGYERPVQPLDPPPDAEDAESSLF